MADASEDDDEVSDEAVTETVEMVRPSSQAECTESLREVHSLKAHCCFDWS